jgi:hypothetical protein
MKKNLRSILAAVCLLLFIGTVQGQSSAKEIKPYKINIAGRQLTLSSSKMIKQVMVWTTDGNRVVEQKNIDNNTIKIDIPISRRAFFVMISLGNGKIYTEKMMIQ